MAIAQSPEAFGFNQPNLIEETYEFPSFDTNVEQMLLREAGEPDQFGNILDRYRVVMSDGTKLGLNYCMPKDPVTDVPILETPAWFTGLHGYNEHTQRAFGAMGLPSLEVGHVGEERDPWAKELGRLVLHPCGVAKEMREISLARQAHNMISILKSSAEMFSLDGEQAFVFGNSRGAMTLLGVIAAKEKYDIEIPFALGAAPCFKEGMGRDKITHFGLQFPAEILNGIRIGAENLIAWGAISPNTLNASPKSLAYEFAHTPTLFRGDAGEFLKGIDADQNLLLLSYGNDIAGQMRLWQKGLEGHPNAHVRKVPGAHGSLIDKRTHDYCMQAFKPISEQLRDGARTDNLDLSYIEAHSKSTKLRDNLVV